MTSPSPDFITERFSVGGNLSFVVAHGGVDMEPIEATYRTLTLSTAAALARLGAGDDGIEAALASVAVMEDDPAFNAGFGSVLTRSGIVETDGAVSNGFSGKAVGVGAVPGLRRPAALAYRVMQEEDAVLLVGGQASEYAQSLGISREDLVTEAQMLALQAVIENPSTSVFTGRTIPSETVGCLTVNARGHVSSASSTGGLVGKMPGRVGDACIPGGGYWTDERFGVLCSGSGEVAMNRHLAGTVAQKALGMGLLEAMVSSLRDVSQSWRAVCAIVAVDAANREVVTVHNGSSFPVVVQHTGGAHRLGEAHHRQNMLHLGAR